MAHEGPEKYTVQELHRVVKQCEAALMQNPTQFNVEGIGRLSASKEDVQQLVDQLAHQAEVDMSSKDPILLMAALKEAYKSINLHACAPQALEALQKITHVKDKKDINDKFRAVFEELQQNGFERELDILHTIFYISKNILDCKDKNKMSPDNCASIIWMSLVNQIYPDPNDMLKAMEISQSYGPLAQALQSGDYDRRFESKYEQDLTIADAFESSEVSIESKENKSPSASESSEGSKRSFLGDLLKKKRKVAEQDLSEDAEESVSPRSPRTKK